MIMTYHLVYRVTERRVLSNLLLTYESKRRYYLAAHRRVVVNVRTSNSAFLIFAVLVV